jgi:hypothetical protein
LHSAPRKYDNSNVPTKSSHNSAPTPFCTGAVVIATLANPREKFWGSILALSQEGISLRGVELSSFEDLVAQIKAGDGFTSGVVFFPMHRVERLELDLPEGAILSLAERFEQQTGQPAAHVLAGGYLAANDHAERTLLSARESVGRTLLSAQGVAKRPKEDKPQQSGGSR